MLVLLTAQEVAQLQEPAHRQRAATLPNCMTCGRFTKNMRIVNADDLIVQCDTCRNNQEGSTPCTP